MLGWKYLDLVSKDERELSSPITDLPFNLQEMTGGGRVPRRPPAHLLRQVTTLTFTSLYSAKEEVTQR